MWDITARVKGLLAKNVAQALGWQFVDADLGLESHVGRHLLNILGEQGQKAFYESIGYITSLCAQEYIVVTTDSSVVCSEKNRQLLQQEMTVYLDVSTPVQIHRVARNASPLLSVSNWHDFFEQLHEERDSLFTAVAKLTIQGDDGQLEQHTNSIVETISGTEKTLPKTVKPVLENKDRILFHKELHTKIDLSNQQALYLKLLAQGKTAKEIAREMNVSYRTVEGTIAKLIELTGCSSSKELIALYLG